ncbi:MAG: FAD-dependent oxidoreductase [Opitutaceae bacterium]
MDDLPSYHRPAPATDRTETVDVCVYAANAAGVVAAIQARRLGLNVALLNPSWRVGGLTSCGLSYTDFGTQDAIGGLALDFYRRVGAHYGKETEWCFEPHVAERVLQAWLREYGIEPWHGHYVCSVSRENAGIAELQTTSGARVRAAYFLDCSYEGDLMAAAAVPYVVGRESADTYGESYNGQQVHATHQFHYAVDPYVRPGDPSSGLLPGIDPDASFIPGAADRRVQAYNFRVCLTRRPDLRVPFRRPDGYDRGVYELLARHFSAGAKETFAKFDRIQNGKTDTNNHGAVSTDFIGGNWDWPEADYRSRERNFQAHLRYQMGYHWFMANDSAVPAPIRSAYAEWGPAADEFQESGHWPPQLYIREARRLLGETVMTERHCFSAAEADDPIGLAAYTMDSHNCRRFVHRGMVLNEGNVEVKLPRPYGIGYRAIVPRHRVCDNLLVPVCLSASHIAYGSIRMEPVFMILAQSAATAAFLAFKAGRAAVADVPYRDLRARLEQDGQVVAWNPASVHHPATVNENIRGSDVPVR